MPKTKDKPEKVTPLIPPNVSVKANGGIATPLDEPNSKRPQGLIDTYKVFFKDDDPNGLPECECTSSRNQTPHEWMSHLLGETAWCYGTGKSPSYITSTYTPKPKTDYTKNWRQEYVTPITVAEARKIAFHMHKDQKDKNDEPYWKHLEGVRQGVVVLGGTPEMEIAALFHDAVEDRHTTYDVLKAIGCTDYTIEIVKVMDKGTQTQEEFLEAIIDSKETLAELAPETDPEGVGGMIVSLADTMHNTRRDRLAQVAKKKGDYTRVRLLKKYRPRMARLMMELGIIATEDDQKALDKIATKPVGTGGGTYTGSYSSSQAADKSLRYKGDNMVRNDWPAGWPSPVKEKTKEYSNVYVLHNGETRTAHKDKYYKLWTKIGIEDRRKMTGIKADWTPAEEKEDYTDTNTNYASSYSSSGTAKAKPYEIDQLFRGDWVTFWKAPILTMLEHTDTQVVYLLANGEVKEEPIKAVGKTRSVSTWTQDVWANDKTVKPFGVTEDDILEFLNLVNTPVGTTLDDDLTDDVIEGMDEVLAEALDESLAAEKVREYIHGDGRLCQMDTGTWWYQPKPTESPLVWSYCSREHDDPQDDAEAYVPLCGNVAAHQGHFHGAGSESAWCDGVHSRGGKASAKCVSEEAHSAHWMAFGPDDKGKILCPGVGTATARAQAEARKKSNPAGCGNENAHPVHWVEEDDNPINDWRCPGVGMSESSEGTYPSPEDYSGLG